MYKIKITVKARQIAEREKVPDSEVHRQALLIQELTLRTLNL